jgi:HPt (histidine-containing phosphotransfer) domain-containing protein
MSTDTKNIREEKIVITVDEDLKDLIPGYLDNRLQDIARIQAALSRKDYETIRSIGHNMKGSGGGYGFGGITDIGAAIEDAAIKNHQEEIRRQTENLKSYLDRLVVIYPD